MSLRHGDPEGHEGAGAQLCCRANSVTVTMQRKETFAYLSSPFLLCYACHFFEAIFFLMGNHSESTNRTICPIVLKTKVLIIF